MKPQTIVTIIEFVLIIILAISLGNANKKIKKYENEIQEYYQMQENEEEYSEEDEENEDEENDEENNDGKITNKETQVQEEKQETSKILPGTDLKEGLYIQNVNIQTENGISTLYADVVNNLTETKSNVNITMNLLDSNDQTVGSYSAKITSLKSGEKTTIKIQVKNIENVERFIVS